MRGYTVKENLLLALLLNSLVLGERPPMMLAQLTHSYVHPEAELEGGYVGAYFIASQLVLLGLVFICMKLDWATF